jgi:polysaccharide pyruvyl transferase WcaK-like protein
MVQVIGDPGICLRIPLNNKKCSRVKVNKYLLKLVVSLEDVAIHKNAKSANDNRHSSVFFEILTSSLIRLLKKGRRFTLYQLAFIKQALKRERDNLFTSTIRNEMKHPESLIVKRFKNPLDIIIADFKDADFCIRMLLHSLIFAFITNFKYLAISYHRKVRYAARDHALKQFNLGDRTTNSYNVIQYALERLMRN